MSAPQGECQRPGLDRCPRTWPEDCWPTPEQFVAYFETACETCRIRVAAQAIRDGQAAMSCAVRHAPTLPMVLDAGAACWWLLLAPAALVVLGYLSAVAR